MLSRTLVAVAVSLSLPAFVACASSDAGSGSSDVTAGESSPITLENWVKHPKIVPITRTVEGLEKDRESRALVAQTKNAVCTGFGEKKRSIWSDRDQAYRIYQIEEDLGDVTRVRTIYYDPPAPSTERFAFHARIRYMTERWTVFGGRKGAEQRAFFDGDGKRIWEVAREVDANGNNGAFHLVAADKKLALASDQTDNPEYAYASAGVCLTADEAARRIRDAGLSR